MNERGAPQSYTGMEIAVVGMAGRFPGARNSEEFWRNLRDGVESITTFTDEQLIARGASPAQLRLPGYVKSGRIVEGFDRFDAAFFAVNPREAELIDPQQRLFLECAWEAIEDAGYDPDRVPRRTAVFAGSRMNGYLGNVYSNPEIVATVGDLQIQVANDKDYLATRISYKLNLGGPSVTVQSACSTALVAIHLAAQALLGGECDMALAGGVGVRIPELGYLYTEGDVNSPDGHVRAFDAKARGTVFGSGLGLVILKRLEDALAEGDNIRAVIKGSAVTNDGGLKVGFTAPGVDGQARVVRAALRTAEVEPETISYIEAHGTGTAMGDPIEVAALTQAFREKTDKCGFCALGSVKTNIGHLGAAAGIAGVIKTVLALEHRMIPPSLFFDESNPQIDFAATPFHVNHRLRDWPHDGGPRRAGVSAFGMGGTNAHVILEEAPALPPAIPSQAWQLLLLSARTASALERSTTNLADYLEAHPDLDLGDVAYTLEEGRRAFEHRRAVVCRDLSDAVDSLRAQAPERTVTGLIEAKDRPVAFLFSGQGAQHPGMGADLYHTEPAYREEVDRCAALLEPHLGFDLRPLLDPAPEGAEEAGRQLSQTAVTQPALFVVEYALAKLWMARGLTPRALLGHSIGEYVAACLAGVFTLSDALALVAVRGRLMQQLPGGEMLSVPLPENEARALLGPGLSLAAVNAPDRCVVSGPAGAIEELRARLAESGVAARLLNTSHAFHSEMMEPILAPFVQEISAIELRPPQIPYVSNLTGTWITAAQATDPGYWARHLRQPVRFADGVRELCAQPDWLLLEVGPGNTLTSFVQRHPDRAAGQGAIASLPHARDPLGARPYALRALGQLWSRGAALERSGRNVSARRRVPLPTYPFEGERYWIEQGDVTGLAAALGGSAKRKEIEDWFYLPYWKPALPVLDGEPASAGSRWLVFLDAVGLGERLAARLEAEGQSVVTVALGEGFARLGPGSYSAAPARREDYDALLKELVAAGFKPDFILHLWSVGRPGRETPMAAALGDEARGFWSLLFLAQACGKQNLKNPIRLAVVSNHMQRVAGEGFISPGKATLLGPTRTLPLEYPHMRVASIDLLLPEAESRPWEEIAQRLIAETAGGLPDPVVAYRDQGRFLLDYQAVRMGPAPVERLRFRQGGVYLITGGLGGLGLVFAEFLAREFKAGLALLGLSPLPPRDEWAEWLARHDEHNRVGEKIRKVRELEALGAEVLVLAVDVADEGQMAHAVRQVLARFGALHGVLHAAGLAGGGIIQLKSPETAARVLAPKVRGTLALDAALAGLPLDFLVLCSSTIALVGGLGQVDYCAANSFLDAFAQARTLAGGTPTVSLNWGAWQEVGMAVASGLVGGSVAADAAPAGRRDIHPLLDRCLRETAEATVYETDFGAARHWVLADHRILGQPALPGTSYLEMARAAFEDHASVFERQAGETGVEIRDVLFLSPLMLGASEIRLVQTTLEPEGEGFTFRIASRPQGGVAGPAAAWQAHARGKVGPVTELPPVRIDLSAIQRRCTKREIEITGPVMSGSEGLVYWGPRWQSLKRVHVGEGEGLALLELPPEFTPDLDRFALHPALLDVATGLLGFLEEGTHLPISYQRLTLFKPLPARLYSYLRKRTEETGGKETLSVDVTLIDEMGETLVEVERFSMRRVSEAATALRRSASTVAAESLPDASTTVAKEPAPDRPAAVRPVASEGILSSEGVEALKRVLTRGREMPQVAVSAKDLKALFAQVRALDRGGLMDRPDMARGPKATHARPNLPNAYVAPRSAIERRLAEIFQNALGIQEVGVEDNFFDLGGDSIVGIQIVARANEAGLTLSPDQLFEHQTIADLGSLIDPAETGPIQLVEPATAISLDVEPAAPFAKSGLAPAELDKVLAKLKGGNH